MVLCILIFLFLGNKLQDKIPSILA
jgi:hypothetical protein